MEIGIDPVPRFSLGDMAITHGAITSLDQASVKLALARHAAGDWGNLNADDRRANEEALASGGRLVSIYKTASGVKFYIITEADRSRTTVLLPEEY